jgi:colicin import membrane protein
MEPRYRRGRRYESMDPVLCTAEGCYVSNGPEEPASFLYGRGATRFGNAIGRRAGACNHTYTCVFRNVDLGRLPAELQPVDIRIIRHDRRSPEWVEALSNCRMTVGNRLTCTGAIEGDGYTMWVISEMAAERLPLHAFSGIADGERAEADPKLMGPRERW